MPRRVAVHVIFNRVADDLTLQAVGKGADDVKWRALNLPLALPKAGEDLRRRPLVERAQSNGQRVVLRRFGLRPDR